MSSAAPLLALIVFMALTLAVGYSAGRASESGGFMKGFFLGNRGLGAWSMALTATVMSGGTFMGFPSLIYHYGWVLALWIASYMMVPLLVFAVMGKPLGTLARSTGAITVPDMLRERFQSPKLGVVSSLLIIFILASSLPAQFKAGAIILQKVLPPIHGVTDAAWTVGPASAPFIYGLGVFTLVVLAYTVYGGFLAAVWTDVFQSILMAVGILILFPLTMIKAGSLTAGTMAGIHATSSAYAYAPGAGREFLPISLAISFFLMWTLAGMGHPATLVRMMAFRDTKTLRHATIMLAIYNLLIYVPLVFIFIAARAILPHMEKPDEVMPTLTLVVANPWIAGLILTAPFGAVMATVSGFLVQVSSALVQDLYHRKVNPHASEKTLRLVSQMGIVVAALAGGIAAIYSPKFLQALIVFAGGCAASAFLVPALMAAYWKRATASGALWAMLGGVTTTIMLYLPGVLGGPDPGIGEQSKFYPYYLLGFAPFVWGLLVSAILGIGLSLKDRAIQS